MLALVAHDSVRAVSTSSRRAAASLAGVLAGLSVCCLVPGAITCALGSKPNGDAWARCGVGERSVRGIATAPDGRLWVATEDRGGDALESSDRCLTATPLGLRTDVVWNVAWIDRTRELCAAARGALFCGPPHAMRTYPLPPGDDVYWAVDPHDLRDPTRLLSGGYPNVLAREGDRLASIASVGYAASAATVSSRGVLIGGSPLRMSVDGGHTFHDVTGVPTPVLALGAHGDVVYAAGGISESFVARSVDGGLTWTRAQSPGAQPESVLVPGPDPDVVVVGTHGHFGAGDAWLSRDGGSTWEALGCPGAEIHALAIDDTYLYCGATALTGARGMWRIERARIGL